MQIPFLAVIIQGIPEQIAVVTLAFVIAKLPLEWRKIILLGITLALTSYAVRLLPITFGIHTILLIGLLFFLVFKFGQCALNTALIASLASFLTLIIVETISISALMYMSNLTPDTIFSDTTTRIIISYPQVLIVFFIAFVVRKVKSKRELA